MSDLSHGLEEQAGLISWYVGVWHDLGYENPPAPGCKPVPPLGERSSAAIEGACKAIEVIGEMCGQLGRLREQLTDELRQDGEARRQAPAQPCGKCRTAAVARPGEARPDGQPGMNARFCARCLDICHEALEFDHVCVICASPEERAALGLGGPGEDGAL